jgi:hypothetical protein
MLIPFLGSSMIVFSVGNKYFPYSWTVVLGKGFSLDFMNAARLLCE